MVIEIMYGGYTILFKSGVCENFRESKVWPKNQNCGMLEEKRRDEKR